MPVFGRHGYGQTTATGKWVQTDAARHGRPAGLMCEVSTTRLQGSAGKALYVTKGRPEPGPAGFPVALAHANSRNPRSSTASRQLGRQVS